MYAVQWDQETGGILLTSDLEGWIRQEIRPVFFEELDLLGFDSHWKYPRCEEPLLWAIGGRKYYYQGELVAEAEGGGLFTPPRLKIHREGLELQPVKVQEMLKKNNSLLQGLIQKSLRFIYQTYNRYRKEVDIAAVAFSGGKDSLVLLDLVQRVLEPEQFVVIFGDTGMEVRDTYRAVEEARKRWPHLSFYTAKSSKDALTTWREMGPPSRIHRWCCVVHKSAPTLLLLREITGKPAVRALIFDGVRHEESAARAGYFSTSSGEKHKLQMNARPILSWNSAEVFLYLFSRSLLLNKAYRYGAVRVGCAICPMASEWKEVINSMVYKEDIEKFVAELRNYARKAGVKHEKIDLFLEKGGWKGRAGGRFLDYEGKRVVEYWEGQKVIYFLERVKENWLEWAKTLGRLTLKGNGEGYIERQGWVIPFSYQKRNEDEVTVSIEGLTKADRHTLRDFRAVALKSAYCTHCRGCQVECPTGALGIDNKKVVISEKCISCGKCLRISDGACLAASSLKPEGGLIGMGLEQEKNNLRDYRSFGLRKEWLREVFSLREKWIQMTKIGSEQIVSVKLWLKHAEIATEKSKKITFSELFEKLSYLGADSLLTWAIIWTNLARNSAAVRWYVKTIKWGSVVEKSSLVELMGDSFPQSKRTRENAVKALLNLFKESPLGNIMGLGEAIEEKGKQRYVYKKGWGNPIPEAILYSLYRYAEKTGRYELTVRELYQEGIEEGPYALFGVEEEKLKAILRGLASRQDGFIKVDLVRDLDNIFLDAKRRAVEVLDHA
ncbi:MAG: phosphoadenosine phosphosulfate reductase [Eubacteriales bacterium]|nr:phosphoadenosine phosphosulfate reductase [Eubacteriales bacterium]